MLSPFPWHELEAWFRNKGRHDLPWRQIFDRDDATRGYQVYLSEIILQQTQVERGKLYFERILDRFPTIQALANTTFESLFRVTSGLGYYRRMHMMIETAKIVSSQYGGIFPRNPEELEKLPGIGTYTARAIAAFTYEEPFLSFDTNLKKIFSRFYHGSRLIPLSNKEQREIENDFRKSGYSSRMINGALMDFWSLVSTSDKKHIDFRRYPLSGCLFAKEKGGREIEVPKSARSRAKKYADLVVILHRDHREYFSINKKTMIPFVLSGYHKNSRAAAKEYFWSKYRLIISVRPIDTIITIKRKKYAILYAQIQTGRHTFNIFRISRWELKEATKTWLSWQKK